MILSTIVRPISSSLLIYAVYTETGIYTAIAFGCVLLSTEVTSYLVGKILKNKKGYL